MYGYYDLFLINPDGYCFYTAAKEADYQTNLVNGKYSTSNLGKLVRQVMQTKKAGFADFEPYEPSNGDPASFIAQPVLDRQGNVELVVALQMPLAWKVNSDVEKWPVREAFKDELPEYILRRRKNPLSYSSGLHERVRMYKILFSSYYNEFRYDLHAPIKMDFSFVLERNNFDFEAAVAEDRLAKDYPRLELLKEMLKAGLRNYLIGER